MMEDSQVSAPEVGAQHREVRDEADSMTVLSYQNMPFDRNVLLQYERRLQALESEVQKLHEILQSLPEQQERQKEEFKKKMAEMDGVQGKMKEMARSYAESNKAVQSIEKRVEGVRKYATSGVMASVLIFSFMLIFSVLLNSK